MQEGRLLFRRRHRLSRDRDFQAVLGARVRKSRGPITVFARPNDLEHPRLGLTIGRHVGGAVTRNNLKRRLREAFRLSQHELPQGFDYVVTSRRHQLDRTDAYREHLLSCARALEREWCRRRDKNEPDEPAR